MIFSFIFYTFKILDFLTFLKALNIFSPYSHWFPDVRPLLQSSPRICEGEILDIDEFPFESILLLFILNISGFFHMSLLKVSARTRTASYISAACAYIKKKIQSIKVQYYATETVQKRIFSFGEGKELCVCKYVGECEQYVSRRQSYARIMTNGQKINPKPPIYRSSWTKINKKMYICIICVCMVNTYICVQTLYTHTQLCIYRYLLGRDLDGVG